MAESGAESGAEPGTTLQWTRDAFISHSSQDRVAVEQLTAALEKEGVSCWLSSRDLLPSRDFPAALTEGIVKSRTLVVVISRASVEAEYVRDEVLLARNLKHRILPVRLDEVALGDLQLLVGRLQDVKLYEHTPEHQYRRIADSIKAAGDPPQPSPIPVRKRWPPWAPLAAVALVVVALVLIQQSLQAWWIQRSLHQAESMLRGNTTDYIKRREQEQLRTAGVSAASDGPTVQFQDWGGEGVQLQISRVRKARVFYSTDDRQFVEYGNSTTFKPAADGKFIVMLKDPSGNEVGRFDRSAELAAAMRASLQESARIRTTEQDQWGCDVYGCRFLEYSKHPVVCSAYVSRIAFGKAQTDSKSRDACAVNTGALCVSASDFSFPLRPGGALPTTLTMLDGGQIQVDIPVVFAMNVRSPRVTEAPSSDHWLELQPLTDRNPKGPAPFAAARYEPPPSSAGEFRVIFGVDACDSAQARLLADSDGRGLIDTGEYRGEPLTAYYTPGPIQHQSAVSLGPDTKTLALAVDHGDGRTTGPYWYAFNAGSIAERTGAVNEAPELVCPGGPRAGYIEQNYRVCRAANPLAWRNVVAVKLGREQAALAQEIKVDFNVQDYLRYDCRVEQNRCPPFYFKIPPGWTDVFSVIATKDGKPQRVVRHVLPRQ